LSSATKPSSKQDIDALIDEIVATIRDGYQPEKIILFGSRATGDTHEWSDVDLFVVKDTDVSQLSRTREVLPFVRRFQKPPHSLPIDVLVATPSEMQSRLAVGDPFIREILTDGKVLYERAQA
jgi:predicted nucleotidyltransferase